MEYESAIDMLAIEAKGPIKPPNPKFKASYEILIKNYAEYPEKHISIDFYKQLVELSGAIS